MFFIPGELIAIFTFPGVIVHEMAHKFFCDLAKVPVYDVCYFTIGNPSGYVVHGKSQNIKDNILISVGPLIVNTTLCIILTLPVALPSFILKADDIELSSYFLGWVGISIGMHAFPSTQDVDTFLNVLKTHKKERLLLLIAWPFAFVMKLANALSIFWFDFIYAFMVSMIVPALLINVL